MLRFVRTWCVLIGLHTVTRSVSSLHSLSRSHIPRNDNLGNKLWFEITMGYLCQWLMASLFAKVSPDRAIFDLDFVFELTNFCREDRREKVVFVNGSRELFIIASKTE